MKSINTMTKNNVNNIHFKYKIIDKNQVVMHTIYVVISITVVV